MLKTVLENLIDNAEKYSDYGSDITINVSDDVLSISNSMLVIFKLLGF